ncbi:zinc finger protein 507 [Trichomycterus rosablanca]|uniref:zinc finger protein 507 n=1 Tax=Trichomycterus rosablanca TaxID=2290929 RepID=UPI002F359797
MEDSSGVAILVFHSKGQQEVFIPDSHSHNTEDKQEQQKNRQTADSLIHVIEKLSKIVEKQPKRCALSGKKCPSTPSTPVTVTGITEESQDASLCKRARTQGLPDQTDQTKQEASNQSAQIVTCYQCSLCRFLSPTLSALKEHLKQHDEQKSDLVLVCSECRFTSSHHEELEAHVRLHTNASPSERGSGSIKENLTERMGVYTIKTEPEKRPGVPPKKWYSYEQGRYRCLICSYECMQQRNLKTHAWKHAGLVDCSYPIFEDDDDQRDAPPVYSPSLEHLREDDSIVVLAPVGERAQILHGTSSIQVEVCPSEGVKCDTESVAKDACQEAASKEPPGVVQVTPEAQRELELETESRHTTADSLLSSAQKIISSRGNSAGHVNVIVERLPCHEEHVATKSLLLNPEASGYKNLLASQEASLDNKLHHMYCGEQVDWSGSNKQETDKDVSDPLPDENVPPTRRRTHSECLRLHSLAAEALVAMPLRTPELNRTSLGDTSSLISDTGQKIESSDALAATGELVPGIGGSPTVLNLGQGSKEDLLVEGPFKAGISTSLLTVIERLRERSDQNTSDEDILKELQVNAQVQNDSRDSSEVAEIGGGDSSTPTDASLVDYIAGSDRPYRCRLCLYSSGNKGYVKQHLRVHRQRQPYQCPICEHIACNSKDLQSHMIHHCKSRMYQCKHCMETFHYKSQLKNHEREQHGVSDAVPVGETTPSPEETEKMMDEGITSEQKVFKCDMCDYTSCTYVGVRNHRRIHSSDKPYRCCGCDFATTNMNSLKSHLKKHPQKHQALQLLEQYSCSLCGYVCSHPPSLKSHMWKHAGDQNYNYEQVNKAINEAISQSSRSLAVPLKSTPDPALDRSYVTQDKKDATSPDPTQRGQGVPVRKDDAGHPRAAAEYCVLLFCCCICGFESTSKEQLMEHMKEHEGDIISIILNKEQQANVPGQSGTVQ